MPAGPAVPGISRPGLAVPGVTGTLIPPGPPSVTTYAVQVPQHPGSPPTWVTPMSGDQAPTGAANYLVVFNGSGSAITVSLPISRTYDGLPVSGGRSVNVPASTLAAPAPVFIPLPSTVYGPGAETVDYSTTATVSVCVIGVSVS